MAVSNSGGHGVTSVLAGSGNNVVKPVTIAFPPAPTQNGGVPNPNA